MNGSMCKVSPIVGELVPGPAPCYWGSTYYAKDQTELYIITALSNSNEFPVVDCLQVHEHNPENFCLGFGWRYGFRPLGRIMVTI